MVNRGIVRTALAIVFLAGAFVTFTPTAAAHDPDCLVTFHEGPVKAHIMCDPEQRDESHCTASVKVLFVHQRFNCE